MNQLPNTEPKNPKRSNSQFLKYSGMATQMLGTILLFTFAGLKLDSWLGSKIPVWTIVLSLTGIGGSLYLLIRNLPKI